LHPNFLDQLFLNRLDNSVSVISSSTPAIEIPRDAAAWPAPDAIEAQIDELNSQGKFARTPGKPIGNYELMIVRIGIIKAALKTEQKINAGAFTLSQLRLISKSRGYNGDLLAGKGQNVYPIGHLNTANQIETSSKIEVERDDFARNARTKYIDFLFAVPNGHVPAMVEFKLNNIVQIPANAILTDAAEAPPAADSNRSSGNQRPDNNPPPDSEEQSQGAQRPQSEENGTVESNENPPEQNRVENLTESITGVQFDEDQ